MRPLLLYTGIFNMLLSFIVILPPRLPRRRETGIFDVLFRVQPNTLIILNPNKVLKMINLVLPYWTYCLQSILCDVFRPKSLETVLCFRKIPGAHSAFTVYMALHLQSRKLWVQKESLAQNVTVNGSDRWNIVVAAMEISVFICGRLIQIWPATKENQENTSLNNKYKSCSNNLRKEEYMSNSC